MIIEAKIISYLSGVLDVPVYAEIPENIPDEYVTVDLMGGGIQSHIMAATVSLISHSTSKLKAAKLDEKVREKLLDITELNEISSCKLGGMDSDIDTATKTYRYESIFNLIYY